MTRALADEGRFENIDRATRKVPCPKCPAKEYEVCRTAAGKPTWECHRARYELARAQGHLPMVPEPVVTEPTRSLIRRLGHRSSRPSGYVI